LIDLSALSVLKPSGLPMEKGDRIVWAASGKVGGEDVNGVVGIKFTSVTDERYSFTVMPLKVPSMKKAKLEFAWDGGSLADLGGIVAGWSAAHDGVPQGTERVQTKFGPRDLERFMRLEAKDKGTLRSDQWVEPLHRLPMAARLTGAGGDVSFTIADTDLKWLRTGSK